MFRKSQKPEANVVKNTFDELFGQNQTILDDLRDWIQREGNRDALFMLDGVLLGLRSIVHQKTRDMGRYPRGQ